MNKNLKEVIKKAGREIKSDSKIVIFGHLNPDGDAMGSTLALKHCLKNKVKQVNVILPNSYPYFLDWMPGAKSIIILDKETEKAKQLILEADILFFCDFNDVKRIKGAENYINVNPNVKIMIDHHPNPSAMVDFLISDTSVCSASELMYEFLVELYGLDLTKEVATCLMTGIITDTGLFEHNAESIRTFEIVAKLLQNGAEKQYIIDKIYNEKPYRRMQLLGNVLYKRMVYLPEYGTSYIYISKEDMKRYNYQDGDSQDFVNIALAIENVNFAAIFTEKEQNIKVSLRSKGNFDVNEVARTHFRGGGHKNAAGGKSYKSLKSTIKQFNELLEVYKDRILKST